MTSDILEDIKKEILEKLPKEIQVSKVEFEGPEVVVYTKNPEIITENGDLIRSLAKELRKRIIIRSDKCALLEPEETTGESVVIVEFLHPACCISCCIGARVSRWRAIALPISASRSLMMCA